MLGNCVRCKCIHIVYCIAEQRISISPPLLSHRTRKQQRPVGSRDDRDAVGGNRIATNHRVIFVWKLCSIILSHPIFTRAKLDHSETAETIFNSSFFKNKIYAKDLFLWYFFESSSLNMGRNNFCWTHAFISDSKSPGKQVLHNSNTM